MSKKIKIIFNNKIYKTKKSFEIYVHDLIYNKIGECDSINKSKYKNEFIMLLQRHPEYKNKTNNVKDFKIVKNRINKKGLEINIINKNNSITNISWKTAINGKKKSKMDNLNAALRNAIYPQIKDFKKTQRQYCIECYKTDNLHVDHIIDFKKLVCDFLKSYDKTKIPIEVGNINGKHFRYFLEKDRAFKDDWYKYHLENASLQILCEKCNLCKPKYIEPKLLNPTIEISKKWTKSQLIEVLKDNGIEYKKSWKKSKLQQTFYENYTD